MIHTLKNILVLCLLPVLFISCRDTDENNTYQDISIGKDAPITALSINKESTRNILLSGGNGKYEAYVENSKIAKIEISHDTLKIKGILEGTTFATIYSYNKKARLDINVVPPDISISHNQIHLYPSQESKFVSLTGGGDIVDLDIDDPDKIMSVKWNAHSNILEIIAHYEGEATIRAKSTGLEDKILKVKIASEGETNDIGLYSTNSRYAYSLLPNKMITIRKNVGVWISSTMKPYGIAKALGSRIAIKTSMIKSPKKGEYIDLNVKLYPYISNISSLKSGINRLYVEDVKDKVVVLRGRGIKMVLPYEK